MKRSKIFLYLLCFFFLVSCAKEEELKDGDLIFQTSLSQQSKYIQIGTLCKYSHCGIIFHIKGKPYVYEAVQPVKYTPLEQWINRGKDHKYTVKRLKRKYGELDKEQIRQLKNCGYKYKGRAYDIYFQWSDKRIYCSELIWKIYAEGIDIELCKARKVKSYLFAKIPMVKNEIKRRGINLEEFVIAPSDLYKSHKLRRIKCNVLA